MNKFANLLAGLALGAGLGTLAFDFAEAWSMAPAVAFLALLMLQDLVVPIAAVERRAGAHNGAPIIAIFHAARPAGSARFRLPANTLLRGLKFPHMKR